MRTLARGWWTIAAVSLALASCALDRQPAPPGPQAAVPSPPPQEERMRFSATAYSIEGQTAAGDHAREGVVAADPKILPLGSRIRVEDAGPYSGEYVVKDTGRAIDGREIDIYIASDAEAKKFGRQEVQVVVLSRASGARNEARQADVPPTEVKAPALR